MVIILFDNAASDNLYPLTQTKAVADIRYGIFTPKERWQHISGLPVAIKPKNYLTGLYESILDDTALANDYLFIDASLKDEDALRAQVLSLHIGDALYDNIGLIACRTSSLINDFSNDIIEVSFAKKFADENNQRLEYPWQIMQWNDVQLSRDFLLLFSRNTIKSLSETNKIIQPENIIIEEGAVVEHCIINASTGPVFIGKNALIMEGSVLRGPIAICENAVVKMATKIYGATTISSYCTVGGEIKNSVLQSFSNKAHDGYLGDAVIGSWCNLGAGTSNSNVKNSGNDVYVHYKPLNTNINAGKKCGVIMGDYSRTAINTSINTGSVIGVCCNIFGAGLTPKYINDFSWGMDNTTTYTFEKAIEHICNWKAMKGEALSVAELTVLKYIFDTKA